MIKNIILLFALIFWGCSSIINKNETILPKNEKYAISPFWNYTDTPKAGLSASTIVESIISNKVNKLYSLIDKYTQDDNDNKENFLNQQKEEARALGVSYLIVGDVQEWRYKTGVDGEPVVSYSIKIIDLNNNRTVFNSVGAKSGWGHKSIGVVAQEIADEIIPKFY